MRASFVISSRVGRDGALVKKTQLSCSYHGSKITSIEAATLKVLNNPRRRRQSDNAQDDRGEETCYGAYDRNFCFSQVHLLSRNPNYMRIVTFVVFCCARGMSSKARKTEAEQDAGDAATIDISTILGAHTDEFEKIRQEMSDMAESEAKDVVAVHQKYKGLKRPLLEKRFAVIQKVPQFWYHIVCHLNCLIV